MFKDIQVTLYDIFGYLLPGAVVFAALTILTWSIFWPSHRLALESTIPTVELVGLVVAMYIAGHLVQGLGNVLESLVRRWKLLNEMPLSAELTKLVRGTAGSHFGKEVESLSSRELFALCDQSLLHHGSPGEREIFVYREGFYRGTFVALCLLTLALLARMASRPILICAFGIDTELWRRHVAFGAFLAAVGAFFAFRRYIRFAEHCRRAGFLRFLALAHEGYPKKEAKKDGKKD
jgi:hypothetical protein